MYKAFFIFPNNKIVECNTSHIRFILDNPELFNTTKQDLINIYTEYNEPIGHEGKARERIFSNLINQGFIRIRQINNGYTVQVNKLNNFKINAIANLLINEQYKILDLNCNILFDSYSQV